MQVKGEGAYKMTNPVESQGEDCFHPEELLFTQLAAKIVDLPELIKDILSSNYGQIKEYVGKRGIL